MTSFVVARRDAAQLARQLVILRGRVRASKPRERETTRLHGNTVGNEVQVRQRTSPGGLRGDEIEVFIVPFDPVQRRAGSGIRAVLSSEVARAYPEFSIGMARHHPIERV